MKSSNVTLEEAKEAYQWAIGQHSYNDNDRYVLFMQSLGFVLEDLQEEKPVTITKDQLYRAIDGHPESVSEGFTDLVWTYLNQIIEEDKEDK